MLKLTLINNFGNIIGLGYCDEHEHDKIVELQRQIERSGINATVHTERTNNINMDELGDAMREYQSMTNIERCIECDIPMFDF